MVSASCLIAATLPGCGGAKDSALAGDWVHLGGDSHIRLSLNGKAGDPIAGSGSAEVNSVITSFTVSGTETEIVLHYEDGKTDDFKYVDMQGTSLWLGYSSSPNSAGIYFLRP